jgi:UDP-glucose 4-epimerase
MSAKTIAITGISGYFGQLLLPLLEDDPEVELVIGIDHRTPPSANKWNKLRFHQLDIRDPNLSDLIVEADVLAHLAFLLWRLPGTDNIDDINIRGSQKVFQAAIDVGVRKLVFTSSVVAYGLHSDNPIPLTEEAPLRPNPGLYYSRAKGAVEAFLERTGRSNPKLLITRLRPCTVVGPTADKTQMELLVSKTTILVRGYEPPGQLLHEDDLASALHLVIKKDLPGVYNVASDKPCTRRELIQYRENGRVVALPYSLLKILFSILWRTGATVFAPEWVDLFRYPFVLSNEKLKAEGWSPKYTTPEAFQALITAFGERGK